MNDPREYDMHWREEEIREEEAAEKAYQDFLKMNPKNIQTTREW